MAMKFVESGELFLPCVLGPGDAAELAMDIVVPPGAAPGPSFIGPVPASKEEAGDTGFLRVPMFPMDGVGDSGVEKALLLEASAANEMGMGELEAWAGPSGVFVHCGSHVVARRAGRDDCFRMERGSEVGWAIVSNENLARATC